MNPVFCRHPVQQRHGNLRTEPGSQAQCVLDGISPAFRQVQRAQVRVNFLEIGHRRYHSRFQCLHCHDIFDARAHGMTGEAFRVGDHNLIGAVAEDVTQRVDLRCRAAAACGGVSFVGNKDCPGAI